MWIWVEIVFYLLYLQDTDLYKMETTNIFLPDNEVCKIESIKASGNSETLI